MKCEKTKQWMKNNTAVIKRIQFKSEKYILIEGSLYDIREYRRIYADIVKEDIFYTSEDFISV